jgi:hypothetical protein
MNGLPWARVVIWTLFAASGSQINERHLIQHRDSVLLFNQLASREQLVDRFDFEISFGNVHSNGDPIVVVQRQKE